MTNIEPFIKWAGGKRQMLPTLEKLLPETYNSYFEPFIGAGALLFDICPKKAFINDINNQLTNTYIQLKNNPDSVIELINQLDEKECSKEKYYEIRERYNQKIKDNVLDFESAGLFIWINKHCFNGLYRVNSKGLFNVPFNGKTIGKSINEENIRNISEYLNLNDVNISTGDFEEVCKNVNENDFVFFDSPYVPISKTAGFIDYSKDGFSFEDHKRLSELFKELDKKGAKLLLTNNDVPLVRELYNGYNFYLVDVNRSINRNGNDRKGKEVIITNY